MSEERWLTAEAALRAMAEGTEQESFQCNNVARAALEHIADLSAQLADVQRDYTGACEAIRQLEANVAELRGALAADDSQLRAAEERVWPGMTHGCDAPDWLADELLWTRTQLAEARAEVERTNHVMRLERMARQVWMIDSSGKRVQVVCSGEYQFFLALDKAMQEALKALPAPSAALQRVREQAVADFLARCEPKPSEESVKKIVASMFPTPDAGGPT